jgi:hypothetical protein
MSDNIRVDVRRAGYLATEIILAGVQWLRRRL